MQHDGHGERGDCRDGPGRSEPVVVDAGKREDAEDLHESAREPERASAGAEPLRKKACDDTSEHMGRQREHRGVSARFDLTCRDRGERQRRNQAQRPDRQLL